MDSDVATPTDADAAGARDPGTGISLRQAAAPLTAAAAVACAALLGAAVVSRLNARGLALTPDSFRYLGMAHTLVDGHGYARPFGSPGLPAETGFPPLYPTLLAAADVAGVSVLRWAAWINAAAFAALIVLVAAMVYDLSRSALATVLGAALTLTFVPLLDLYVHVWSEPTYLVWQVLALWMLARYNARGARTDLVIAGVAASLGALTRYAGLALLPAGLIVLLAARRRPLRVRLVDCAAYAAITAIPLGLWLARNVLVASSATGRTVSYRPLHSERLDRAWITVSGWGDTLRLGSPAGLWWLAALLAVALAAGVLWYRSFDGLRNDAGWGLVVSLVFLVVYAVFLWVSVAVAARGVHLTGRILSPLMLGMILVVMMAGQVSWSASPARYAVPALLGLAAVVVVVHAGGLERDAVRAARVHREPFYVRWRSSPLISQVEALPPGTVVYSNLPGPLWEVTGRHVLALPDPRLPAGAGPNPDYAAQLRDTRGDLARNHGVVVDLTGSLSRYLAARGHWPPPVELAPRLGLAAPRRAGGDAMLRATA
ncbi:MAG TPA: hypothetical protein VGQ45_12980 [Gaiellales bacterium]|nr:hypothetical protein [Gaiellales bacterium]